MVRGRSREMEGRSRGWIVEDGSFVVFLTVTELVWMMFGGVVKCRRAM